MNVQTIDLSKYVEIPEGQVRPHIRGRRVPVATLAYSARSQGWNNAELAYQFTLTEAEVLAALLYYAEHQTEIDKQEEAYQVELDRLHQRYSIES